MKYLYAAFISLMILTTSGCVGLLAAGAATTAVVVTDPRSADQIWADKNIELEVAGINNKAPYSGQARITATSYNGIVVLIGQANTEQISHAFDEKVRKLKGVKAVHNEIRIMPPLDVGKISNDTWITTKVKSALLTSHKLNGLDIKVITEDKETFLFGYVTPQQANVATNITRNISGVKRVVQAFQYNDKAS
ncbi:BON domain-containing protein [Vibrio profundum]|uniref:BON domain-containing protein n=1 Tax=Vibrio profundum TaxID=2910247 RepID=UPI003D0DF141